MFGISSSVFNETGSLVKDWLKNPLNASFLYWYFLPAAGFVLLQLFIVGPALGHQPPKVFSIDAVPSKGAADLILQILNASFVALIILPLAIGVVLSAISGTILRLYQGTLPIARYFFRPWLVRNQKRSSEFYGPLQARRHEYLLLASRGIRMVARDGQERSEVAPESERAALADQLKQEIQNLHEKFEAAATTRPLPVDVARVGANDLANTLALAEEYAFERYGMDAAVFWPRVSAEIESEKLESLTASFGAMNGLLNLSLLSCLFAIESVFVGVALNRGWYNPGAFPLFRLRWLLIAAFIGIVIGVATYRAAVRAAHSVGNAMRTAFDYYRGHVLRRFNLKMPTDIEEERVVWLKLAAFIRRGESFYYPSEFRDSAEESGHSGAVKNCG